MEVLHSYNVTIHGHWDVWAWRSGGGLCVLCVCYASVYPAGMSGLTSDCVWVCLIVWVSGCGLCGGPYL